MEQGPSNTIKEFIPNHSLQFMIHEMIMHCEPRIRDGDETVWKQIGDYLEMRLGVPMYNFDHMMETEYKYTEKILNSGCASDFEKGRARIVRSILEVSMDQWKKLKWEKEVTDEIVVAPRRPKKVPRNPTRILPSRRAKIKSQLSQNQESSSLEEDEEGRIISGNKRQRKKPRQKKAYTSKSKEGSNSNHVEINPESSSSLIPTDSTTIAKDENEGGRIISENNRQRQIPKQRKACTATKSVKKTSKSKGGSNSNHDETKPESSSSLIPTDSTTIEKDENEEGRIISENNRQRQIPKQKKACTATKSVKKTSKSKGGSNSNHDETKPESSSSLIPTDSTTIEKDENEEGRIISEKNRQQQMPKQKKACTATKSIQKTSKSKEESNSNHDETKPESSSSLIPTGFTFLNNYEFLKDKSKLKKFADSDFHKNNGEIEVNIGSKKKCNMEAKTGKVYYTPEDTIEICLKPEGESNICSGYGNNYKKIRFEDTCSLASFVANKIREENGNDCSKSQDLTNFSNSSNGSTVPPTTDTSKHQQLMALSTSELPPQESDEVVINCLQDYKCYKNSQDWASNLISYHLKREDEKIVGYRSMFDSLLSVETKKIEILEKLTDQLLL